MFRVPFRLSLLALAVALTATLAGCGGGGQGLTAVQLGRPEAIPAGTFTDTNGQPYDLQQQAKGRLTLVFFGYTNCPDECPTTMADLATALRSLPESMDRQVQVVFITSDPRRDTPAVMKDWLSKFDSGVANPFIGLRTSVESVDAFGKKLGVALEPPVVHPDGTEEVVHGTQTLIFAPSSARADYFFELGTTPKQYAHDIAHFVKT